MTLLYHLLFGISIFGFIFSAAIMIRRKPLAYYFFIGVYLIFNFSLFVNVIIPLGFIYSMPHLYRVVSPLQFLFGPLTYFFFRSTLRPYRNFGKSDWIHFLPFLISILGLLPIFAMPAEEKLKLIHLIREYKIAWHLKDTFGLDYVVAFRIKFIIFIFYLLIQWKMLFGYTRNASWELRQNNKSLQTWLFFDLILKSLICFILFASSWFEGYAGLASIMQMLLVSFEIIASAFFLIASPELLKGVVFQGISPNLNYRLEDDQYVQEMGGNTISGQLKLQQADEIMFRIEQLLQLEQPFLESEFNISDLSLLLKLPTRNISFAIKLTKGIGFPEYINKKRLLYLEKLLQANPEMLNYSVDALARSVGFNSRSGFYKAFKKAGSNGSPAKMIALIREQVNPQK